MKLRGSITRIVRSNKGNTPDTVRYRFRMGSNGKPVFFSTKAAAQKHQKQVSAAIKERGYDALKVLDKDVLRHVTAALELLKASGLDSQHLLMAVNQYKGSISSTSLTVTIGEAFNEAMQTPRYQSLRPSSKRNLKSRWGRLVKYIGADTPLGLSLIHI